MTQGRRVWLNFEFLTGALVLYWLLGASFLFMSAHVTSAAAPALAEDVTSIRTIDGHPVVFQYGRPVPSFLLPDFLPPQRDVISLDGAWLFAPDDGKPTHDLSEPWKTVQVPHVWDRESGLATFDGPVWYRRTVALPASIEGRRVRLVFLGAADEATVYVNGVRAGFHRGAYMPFAHDVTDLIRHGETNDITVGLRRRTWGTTDHSLLPPGDHDWWLYGGLFRSVYIEVVPELYVARILTGYREGAMQSVVILHNDGNADRNVIVRFDPGWDMNDTSESETRVRAGETAAIAFELPVSNEILWTPTRPRTFVATAELIDRDSSESLDVLSEHYGLVDVTVSGSKLLLNGEPLFIKGVNWHTDDSDVGAAYRLGHFERDFGLILSAGANLVRFSHYPRHPEAYRLADRLGLMVMDEAPNYWMDRSGILHQLRDGLSATYVQSMVWNHMNHPSVILWSLLNESETGVRGGTAARDFIDQLGGAVRTLDLSGRPVTYATNRHRDDVGLNLVDVIGVNEYFGFFYGTHGDLGPYLDDLHGRFPEKPVLITEFGDWAVYGTSRQATQSFTFQSHWQQMLDRSDFVAGGIWWVFADHKSRHQPKSAIPYISTMGMVDRDRRPKALFQRFREAPLPAADAHDDQGG